MSEQYQMNDLLAIMAQLRDPETGCPWDKEQSFETISPYTIEEAYEVDDAIRQKDYASLKDELGDLLFQTIFHSQIAEDKGLFNFSDVVNAISDKMVSRHPHVFGDATVKDADAQIDAWEEQKAKERAAKAVGNTPPSALDGVALGLPSLLRALKLQNRAARVGFDWPETEQVLDKIKEETDELLFEVNNGMDEAKTKEEFGDLLFVMANLARHFKLDPEECLRLANSKFERRFRSVEDLLADKGKTPETSNLEEMDALWDQVKATEKNEPKSA